MISPHADGARTAVSSIHAVSWPRLFFLLTRMVPVIAYFFSAASASNRFWMAGASAGILCSRSKRCMLS